jgi:hypothetical protein
MPNLNHRRKKSLDVLVEANIDQLFDTYVDKAIAMVNETTKTLIEDTLQNHLASKPIKAAIKNALDKDPDVLFGFETKFLRCFDEALADAVADLVARRQRDDLLYQLMESWAVPGMSARGRITQENIKGRCCSSEVIMTTLCRQQHT